jgi:hypothetical protein
MRTTSVSKFYDFLKDVYKGIKADQFLTGKHKISHRTQQSCKLLNFTGSDNYSIMTSPPTIDDAFNLMQKNKEIQKVSTKKHLAKKRKTKDQLQLSLSAKKTRQPRQVQPVVKSASTKEISILWGAIKIML